MDDIIFKEQTVSTVELAEALGITHKNLLRKIEGANNIDGVIDILSRLKLAPADYFIESNYFDAQSKPRKCYLCTRKGCEFLAHKFQGEKGILFTVRYIEKFHQMEQEQQENQYRSRLEQNTCIVPEYSLSKVPRARNWYAEHQKDVNTLISLAKKRGVDFHQLLHAKLTSRFDIEAANHIYKKERGYAPKDFGKLICYFREIEEVANSYIDYLLKELC